MEVKGKSRECMLSAWIDDDNDLQLKRKGNYDFIDQVFNTKLIQFLIEKLFTKFVTQLLERYKNLIKSFPKRKAFSYQISFFTRLHLYSES